MPTGQHLQSQAEQAVLEDAKAMAAAAAADADVKKKLGDAYLKRVDKDIAEAEALAAGKGQLQHAKVAEGARVSEIAGQLLDVMRDIRDALKLAGEPAATQKDFGVGADWKVSSPAAMVTAARGMEAAFKAHPKVASEAKIDNQHRHDLGELAGSLDEADGNHRKLANDRSDDTAARAHDFAALRADAHHIRLAARLLHRHDAAKLHHFASPVAAHQVAHRAAKSGATTTDEKKG